MAFFPELQERTLQELLADFDSDPSRTHGVPEDEHLLWFMEVARLLAESGELGVNLLIERIPAAEGERLRAILFGLSFANRELLERLLPRIRPVLLSYLGDQRPMLVTEAIGSLSCLGCAEDVDRILPLLHHDSPYVVGSALRFLSRHYPERAKPLLLQSLQSAESIIRQNAIDELDNLQCVEALPQLQPLLDDEDADVRQAAETAVANLEELLPQN
jgi:hypothetical protein